MKIDTEFWSGKKVLVTGHLGFKGGWLSLWLSSLGARVVGYSDDYPSVPAFALVCDIPNTIYKHILGDVNDLGMLHKVISEERPEFIFHLAAQPIVLKSYAEPIKTLTTNIMGTVNLLEAVKQNLTQCCVVCVTSDKCYENHEWVWSYRESDPMGGHDPYSASKGCAEIVISSYRRSFFSNRDIYVASARAGNVIGGGDWGDERLVPNFFKAWAAKDTVENRSPLAIRPWQHVLEPLSGYMCLAQRLYEEGHEFAEGWNFGPYDSDVRTVSWVLGKLSQLVDNPPRVTIRKNPPVREPNYLKLDSHKSRLRLGISPVLSLDEALAMTADWYKKYFDCGNMADFSRKQIAAFTDYSAYER